MRNVTYPRPHCNVAECANVAFRAGMCNRHYRAAPHPLSPNLPKACVVCQFKDSPQRPVKRFVLQRTNARGRCAGSILLCRNCWALHAAPRRVPQRASHRAKNIPRTIPEVSGRDDLALTLTKPERAQLPARVVAAAVVPIVGQPMQAASLGGVVVADVPAVAAWPVPEVAERIFHARIVP